MSGAAETTHIVQNKHACAYPVFSQRIVAGGLLYEGPVVLQTGLTRGTLLARRRLLHASHLMQAGQGLTVLALENTELTLTYQARR